MKIYLSDCVCHLRFSIYSNFFNLKARSRTAHCGLTYEALSSWYARQTDLPDDATFFASVNNTSNGSSEYYSAGYPTRRQSGRYSNRLNSRLDWYSGVTNNGRLGVWNLNDPVFEWSVQMIWHITDHLKGTPKYWPFCIYHSNTKPK